MSTTKPQPFYKIKIQEIGENLWSAQFWLEKNGEFELQFEEKTDSKGKAIKHNRDGVARAWEIITEKKLEIIQNVETINLPRK